MSKRFFITGSGTGVGKTLVTCALAHQLRAQGQRVSGLKPVISGYNEAESDTHEILKSLGERVNPLTVQAISPWRYAAPLAPNVAARREGKAVPFEEVVAFCNLPRTSDITLIEGAGGVMAPLSDSHTMLDFAAALSCPAVLLVGTYLGAISHALTAAHALHARGVALQAVVVSESAGGAMDTADTAIELARFLPPHRFLAALPTVAGAGALWQHAADMTWILADV
jgi:dethiobiotin synthetase